MQTYFYYIVCLFIYFLFCFYLELSKIKQRPKSLRRFLFQCQNQSIALGAATSPAYYVNMSVKITSFCDLICDLSIEKYDQMILL